MSSIFIAASISWNSNKWKGLPTKEDIDKSNFAYVKKNREMFESFNFDQSSENIENNNIYGYIPAKLKSKIIKVCIFISSNNKLNKRYIVGFYFDTEFGDYQRTRPNSNNFSNNIVNLKVKSNNIVLLDKYIDIKEISNKENKACKKFRTLTYLTLNDVYEILQEALKRNSNNRLLAQLYYQHLFNEKELINEELDINSKKILLLDEMLISLTPAQTKHIVNSIERSNIAKEIKKFNKYKCQVCEALKLPSPSFQKKDGEYYIEAHHVTPVSTIKKGVLSIKNIITVCANHHRQMHYGNVELIESDELEFSFKIDGAIIKINKTKIS